MCGRGVSERLSVRLARTSNGFCVVLSWLKSGADGNMSGHPTYQNLTSLWLPALLASGILRAWTVWRFQRKKEVLAAHSGKNDFPSALLSRAWLVRFHNGLHSVFSTCSARCTFRSPVGSRSLVFPVGLGLQSSCSQCFCQSSRLPFIFTPNCGE